jgi:DNA-directed RNA polymerase specialized sigma24 family protein
MEQSKPYTTFEELLAYHEPRIAYHANRAKEMVPGFDYDDIAQELRLELWRKQEKIPEDMRKLDYRLTRYTDTIFSRAVINLHRKMITDRKGEKKYRDALNHSVPMNEFFEDFYDAGEPS